MSKHYNKSITPVDEYKFHLCNELEVMAKEELRETNEMRKHAIKAMREWIMKSDRILITRMDAKYLLRFLRFRKFSVPMAMEALERYLVIKQGKYGMGWLDNLDYDKPSILKLIDDGFVFFLPQRDFMGRKIIFYRPGVADPKSPSVGYDVLILLSLVYELVLEDEENQIRGVIHLADAQNIRMPHFTVFSPQYSFRVGKNTEKTLALRHKAFHIVNVHKSINLISDFIMSHMGEKLRKRTHMYSSFDDFKAIERKNLPLEYGGTTSMRTMIESLKKELADNQKISMLLNQTRVNVDKYPKAVLEGSVKSLKYLLNSSEIYEKFKNQDIYGLQGSFRKLEID
ncbi:hypothetical protein PVAND_000390 [Polypedilum vanderplanki]|uniref:CRAL-TRIO domain-containing protein n=1 Tax=Polypedilum vanderplanki TaxID=319348 RepID=A0A9J6BKS8_POLVA|nr:hypothetical protein PVAND_000390 [Polypedilum vanderplanki]